MSYSRWSRSKWYTWWDTSSGENKEDQVVAVWHIDSQKRGIDATHLTYRDVQFNRGNILKSILEDDPDLSITFDELPVEELKYFMLQVEREYK